MLFFSATIIMVLIGCSSKKFQSKWTSEIAPNQFNVVFETTQGEIILEIERELSPKAVDRFYQLVERNYFSNNYFYRTIPGFVAQFGHFDTVVKQPWEKFKVPDEPVIRGNAKGTLSFGRGGPNSRGTDLYINLVDNHRLDTIHYQGVTGFPTFGKVIRGMYVVENLYSGYASQSMDSIHLMYENPKKFSELFPNLDRIKKAYVLK